MNYDDETLMAYADGELDAARRATLEAALGEDPELARRVERLRALRLRVSGAYARIADDAPPEHLIAAARAAREPPGDAHKVVQFPLRAARPHAATWGLGQWAAMCASVVLGMWVSWKVFAPGETVLATGDGSLIAHGALEAALDRQLASAQGAADPVQIGVTFKSMDGGYCRSFTLIGARSAGLACRRAGDWRIEILAGAESQGGGMRQANAPPAVVMQAIEARIQGEALDAAAEESARTSGWDGAR
jgi:hypothetical protein